MQAVEVVLQQEILVEHLTLLAVQAVVEQVPTTTMVAHKAQAVQQTLAQVVVETHIALTLLVVLVVLFWLSYLQMVLWQALVLV
jgi:hypothetical protein